MNRDGISAGAHPRIAPPDEKKPTVLTTAAAERLATLIERTVTALGSLLIANEQGRDQDVRCLAEILINDLELELCLLHERLARLQDNQADPSR